MSRKWISVLLMWVSPAFGQATENGEENRVLEEIIVTATLREVPLQDLPMSVGVLTGEDLRDIGAVNIDDIWRQIPNMAVRDAPFGGRTFLIRGLTDTDTFLSTESINAFYVDDTPITHVSGLFTTPADVSLLDLARVEALRGPQGTLVGANAMGGAVRFITNDPDPDAREAIFEANFSNTSEGGWNYGGNAVFNQPTGENSAIRLAALYQDDDGFIDDIGLGREDVNSQKRTAARLSWLWNINDKWDVLARVYAENIDTGGYNYADDVGRPWSGIETDGEYQVVLSLPEYRDEDLTIASIRLRRHSDWGEFYSATSYFDKDLAHNLDWTVENYYFLGLDNTAFGVNISTQEALVQEFRLSSGNGERFNWLAGAFYFDQDYGLDDLGRSDEISEDFFGVPAGEDLILVDARHDETRKEWALFGEVSWRFTETVEGTVGLRWFDYDRTRSVKGGGIFIIPAENSGGADGVSPKVSLSWEPGDQTMFYAQVSEGFRPGQFNNPGAIALCEARPLIDDDSLTNYEIGMKFRSVGGSMEMNTAVFHIDWNDMQFNAFGGCPFPVLENVGSATSEGLEVDFSWLATESLELRGGVGYTDATLDSGFVNENANVLPGTPIPNVPEWTANLSATWEFDWSAQLPGYLRADAQYVDERTTLFDETIDFPTYRRIDDYTLFNLRAGMQSGAFTTEFFVTNLFDERAEIFCCRNFYDPAVNRPRTIGIRGVWRSD